MILKATLLIHVCSKPDEIVLRGVMTLCLKKKYGQGFAHKNGFH